MSHALEQESNEPEMIQRLVDGELTHHARSQLLSGIADDSRLWREISLAFVEKQLLDEALGTLIDDAPQSSQIELGDEEPLARVASTTSHHSSVKSWIAGLAACLIVGFFLGFVLNKGGGPPVMQVDDPSPSKALLVERSSIDLADALSRTAVPVPNEFRRALRKAGYSLSDRQTITNVSLPSGGQIELPVRQVDVKFVGISSFQ